MSKPSKKNLPLVKRHISAHISPNAVFQYLFLIALSGIFIRFCVKNAFIQDDTYITLRYVRNFVMGHGLVFNIGERVEGYTCFLWVMILSIAAILRFNIENVSQHLSVFFGLLSLFMTFAFYKMIVIQQHGTDKEKPSERRNSWFTLAPVLFLVFSGPFSFWSVSGMESSLFTFLLVTGLFFHMQKPWRTRPSHPYVLTMLLASLTRPEGVLFYTIIVIHSLVWALLSDTPEPRKSALRVLNAEIILFAAPYVTFTLFRLIYYGHLFPNTFYAKTGLSSVYITAGITYLVQFFRAYLLYGIVLAAPLYLLLNRERRFETSLFYSIILTYCLYIVSVGGDVLSLHRFFLPVLPLIFILWARFLQTIYIVLVHRLKKNRTVLFVAVCLTVFFFTVYIYLGEKTKIEHVVAHENGLVEKMKFEALWLKKVQDERGGKLTVAATTIGALGYFSEATIIDMLGLTDEYIAHHPKPVSEISSDKTIPWKEKKYNAEYILSRKPDHIIFSTDIRPSAYAERALFTEPGFLTSYYPQYINYRGEKISIVIYTRKNSELMARTEYLPPNPDYSPDYVAKYNQALVMLNRYENTKDAGLADKLETVCVDIGGIAPSMFGDEYRILGDVCRMKNDPSGAEKWYRTALEKDEFNYESLFQLYQICRSRNDTEKAAIHLEKILRSSPHALLLEKPYYLGILFLQAKMYNEAVHILKAAALNSNNNDDLAEIHARMGSAYFAQFMYNEATDSYAAVLRLKPGYAAAHLGLAQCYEKRGLSAEAQAEYSEYNKLAGVATTPEKKK